MQRLLLICFLFLQAFSLSAQNGSHQPYSNYWFPNDLLTWSSATDTTAKFNRGKVPLAARFTDTASAPCGANRPAGLKMASLAITNGTTSGNPSQGYDHAGEYAFGFWQYLDYFVMWGGSASEGLILTPSATWIDAGHRNGVKVMGTIFLPPTAYGGQLQWVNDLVQTSANGSYPIADKLITIANYYGFDGWFINQETGGGNAALGEKVISFMKYFQAHKTSNLEIMWYDAMLPTGTVGWQQQLNNANVRMFQDTNTLVSQSMFIDFTWTATKLANSKTKAQSINRNPYDLYAGIDVQANGYNTTVNWNGIFPTLTNPNTSVGLYVPSWTFHSSPDKNNIPLFYQREMDFWIGANGSPCQPPASGNWPGFAQYFLEKSVISTIPFITRFNTGHGTNGFWIGGQSLTTKQWHNQSAQDIQPTWRWIRESSGTPLSVDWDFTDAYNGGNSLKVSGVLNSANTTNIRLYNTKLLLASGNESLKITYKLPSAGASDMKVAIAFTDAPTTFIYLPCNTGAPAGWTTDSFSLNAYHNKTISTIGLRFESAAAVSNYSINIGEIAVTDNAATTPAPATAVTLETFTGCDNAELYVNYTSSTSTDIWYYDIYRVMANNTRQWLGRTSNNVFYVKNIKKLTGETAATIAVVAVNKYGKESAAATQSFTWPAPPQSANYSVSFDGSTKYINAGAVNLSGTAISLDGWVYARSFKNTSPYISSIMGIEENGQNTAELRFGDAGLDSNKLQFVLSIGGNTQKLAANTACAANQWYRVTGTYDGTTMKLYINGQLNITMPVTGAVSANGTFYIGRNWDDTRILNGYIDEVRAWKKALSAAEIAADTCSVSPAATSLEGYWTFDNCAGFANDKTANGHDGMPQHMTAADWATQAPCAQPTGIAEQNMAVDAVMVYPNPTGKDKGFTIRRSNNTEALFYLYDATGNVIQKEALTSREQTLSAAGLSSGIYLYRVVQKDKIITGKLTVL
ncbi:endo-beta-N-acetylglucosaminidase [Chitinophagaceae bacterium MMS25-I14]